MNQERVAHAIAARHGIPLPEAARIARAAAERHRASSPPPAAVAPETPTEPEPRLRRPITRDELARAISLVSSMPLDDASLIADGVLTHSSVRR
jgi:hypothetical protein